MPRPHTTVICRIRARKRGECDHRCSRSNAPPDANWRAKTKVNGLNASRDNRKANPTAPVMTESLTSNTGGSCKTSALASPTAMDTTDSSPSHSNLRERTAAVMTAASGNAEAGP